MAHWSLAKGATESHEWDRATAGLLLQFHWDSVELGCSLEELGLTVFALGYARERQGGPWRRARRLDQVLGTGDVETLCVEVSRQPRFATDEGAPVVGALPFGTPPRSRTRGVMLVATVTSGAW